MSPQSPPGSLEKAAQTTPGPHSPVGTAGKQKRGKIAELNPSEEGSLCLPLPGSHSCWCPCSFSAPRAEFLHSVMPCLVTSWHMRDDWLWCTREASYGREECVLKLQIFVLRSEAKKFKFCLPWLYWALFIFLTSGSGHSGKSLLSAILPKFSEMLYFPGWARGYEEGCEAVGLV